MMKKFFVAALLLSIMYSGCKKDDVPDLPVGPTYKVETGTVSGITNYLANVSGKITNVENTNISIFGHVWSTTQNPTTNLSTKTEFGSISSDTSFLSQLKALEKGTTYYIRAYATDESETYYGQEVSFKTSENFFTFVVSSNYLKEDFAYEERAWVMIYTPDGQLLEMEEIVNGNTYQFDWPEEATTDYFMVQLFKSSISDTSYGESDNYKMQCYLDASPETWFLGKEPKEKPPQIGTNTVGLGDINLDDYYFSDFRNNYTLGSMQPFSSQIDFTQYINPDNIWIMVAPWDGKPLYKWFDNVGLNDSYNISSSEMTKMTDYVDIAFPQGNSTLVYIESEDNLQTDVWEYFVVNFEFIINQSNVRAYYPGDLFSGYYTQLIANTDIVKEYMVKLRGAIPDQFVSLPVDIQVINSSVLNFKANISDETDLANPNWVKTEGEGAERDSFTYDVNGSKSSVSTYAAPELPQEIRMLNESLLELSNLEYIQTRFYEYDNLNGFTDYLSFLFVEPASLSGNITEYHRKAIYLEGKMTNDVEDFRKEISRIKQ